MLFMIAISVKRENILALDHFQLKDLLKLMNQITLEPLEMPSIKLVQKIADLIII